MPKKATALDPIDRIIIEGIGFDEHGHRYIKLAVQGSDRDLPPYSMAELMDTKRLCQDLCDAGCYLLSPSQRTRLQKYLEDTPDQEPSFQVVTRLGSFGSFFVRPDEVIGNAKLPVELKLDGFEAELLSKYRCQKSLRAWKNKIASLCNGNSRLVFAVSLACTGPILPFVFGLRTGGFQICGKAETGKTAAAMVAGSVWGCHRDSVRKEKGFAESWNTTTNALEPTSHAHCDALLPLDETNVAGKNDADCATNVISGAFRLSESVSKGRYGESSRRACRGYFLSTSNLTFDQLARQAGVSIGDQHRGRLVDVFLPPSSVNGIYEELHGFDSGAELTDALKARCRKFFGTAGYALIQRVYNSSLTRKRATGFLAKRRAWYVKRAQQKAHGLDFKPLQRATSRFATVYAAGCLAAKYKILPWDRSELAWAVLSSQFEGHPSSPAEPVTARNKLINYFRQNLPKFLDLNQNKLDPSIDRLGSAAGYLQTHRGTRWIYLTSERLDGLLSKQNAKRLKQELIAEGALASSSNRTGLVQRPLFLGPRNSGFRWVHAFPSDWVSNAMVEP